MLCLLNHIPYLSWTAYEDVPCTSYDVHENDGLCYNRVNGNYLRHVQLRLVATNILLNQPHSRTNAHYIAVNANCFSKISRTVANSLSTVTAIDEFFNEHWFIEYRAPTTNLTRTPSQFTFNHLATVCRPAGVKNTIQTKCYIKTSSQLVRSIHKGFSILPHYVSE